MKTTKEVVTSAPEALPGESKRPDPNDRPDPKRMRLWTLIIGVAGAVALATLLGLAVFVFVLQGLHVSHADAARTAATLIGVPTAAGAVFVALRSLHVREIQLHTDQQRVVDAYRTYALTYDTEHNRRDSDQDRELRARYVSAAEQMGHNSAAVRLAGVNAMAQLATDWDEQRQSCVDVLCAYLRLPQLKTSSSDGVGTDIDDPADGEVRRTVQRLIADGFSKPPGGAADDKPAWEDTNLDLDGAVLNHFVFTKAVVHKASFKDAEFRGNTMINAKIKHASYVRADFKGTAALSGSVNSVNFSGANFANEVLINIYCVQSPKFYNTSFHSNLVLRSAALRFKLYCFTKSKFTTTPPLDVSVIYDDCTVGGEPFSATGMDSQENNKN